MGKNGKNEEGDKKHLGKRAKNDGKARFGDLEEERWMEMRRQLKSRAKVRREAEGFDDKQKKRMEKRILGNKGGRKRKRKASAKKEIKQDNG
jgi:hypothetical protein